MVCEFRNDIPEHMLKFEVAELGGPEVGGGVLSVVWDAILDNLRKFGHEDSVGGASFIIRKTLHCTLGVTMACHRTHAKIW